MSGTTDLQDDSQQQGQQNWQQSRAATSVAQKLSEQDIQTILDYGAAVERRKSVKVGDGKFKPTKAEARALNQGPGVLQKSARIRRSEGAREAGLKLAEQATTTAGKLRTLTQERQEKPVKAAAAQLQATISKPTVQANVEPKKESGGLWAAIIAWLLSLFTKSTAAAQPANTATASNSQPATPPTTYATPKISANPTATLNVQANLTDDEQLRAEMEAEVARLEAQQAAQQVLRQHGQVADTLAKSLKGSVSDAEAQAELDAMEQKEGQGPSQ